MSLPQDGAREIKVVHLVKISIRIRYSAKYEQKNGIRYSFILLKINTIVNVLYITGRESNIILFTNNILNYI